MPFLNSPVTPLPSCMSQLAALIEVEIIAGMNNCLSVKEIATRITTMLDPDHSASAPARRPLVEQTFLAERRASGASETVLPQEPWPTPC